jgi:putative spermidine/putrescine transport system ATP-binding protein
MVRPESMRVMPGKAAGMAHGESCELGATVQDIVYLGDHSRLVARLDNGCVLTAKIAGAELTRGTEVGAPVSLRWSPDSMRVFARAS